MADVNAEANHTLDNLGIAKNSREEKIKARDEKIKSDAENAKMALEPDAPEFRRVTVRVGRRDSLASIAARNRVSVEQLKSWNNLHQDRLVAGQSLQIQVPFHAGGTHRANHRRTASTHPAHHGKIVMVTTKGNKKHHA